jgi:hypothetical protein
MIYLLTAIGFTPHDSSTVHIYKQTIQRTSQNKQYIEQYNLLIWMNADGATSLRVIPSICLTTEKKTRKNRRQGSRRLPVGTMKTEYTEQNIHNNKNT